MPSISSRLADPDQPVKWLFYGDSITHGALHTFGWRDYTELFAERIRYELGRSQDVVINTAISGDTTRKLLESYDWRVAQFSPDVVFLMIGMNDVAPSNDLPVAKFRDNLNVLADRIEAGGGEAVLQTTCTILPATEGRGELPRYMQAVRQVAQDRGLLLIDHTSHWETLAETYNTGYLLSDAIHPNEIGHRVFAHELFRGLGIFDASSKCCRLFTP